MNYPGVIKEGSKNVSAIRQIKLRLNELGYGLLDPDNPTFGPSTKEVVRRFQEFNQLLDDGIVGSLTWDRLFNTYQLKEPVSKRLAIRALEIAETQLYVREKTGKNDGVEIKKYLNSVGLPEGYAWCAAFVFWCFEQAAIALNVPNPLVRTAGVLNHWNNTKGQKIQKDPQPGDIFIMDYGKGLGHMGIVSEVFSDRVVTIDGNTNLQGSREGDGVYERSRLKSTIKGYIRY